MKQAAESAFYRRCAATDKVFCIEMAIRVTGEAIQIHGGYGFTDEFTVSRLYRGARYGSLGGGTSETLRDLTGKRLTAEVDDADGSFGLLNA
jgi:alkylation response protein AidB-like acyl-CoA dehydrogenase